MGPVGSRARVTPRSQESYGVQCTLSRSTYEKLRYAGELLGHGVPAGDLALLLDRVLDAAIPPLERRKFGATSRPRPGHRRPATDSRHIPAAVRRAVWERDQGRCTFVSGKGHRCEARTGLQFDHVEAYARGGEATVSGIRLLCRAHNQYEAERTFGADFMRHKRLAAAEARADAKTKATVGCAHAAADAPADTEDRDVVPWLRALGFSHAEARRAAERCETMPRDATLQARVRVALSSFRMRGTRAAAITQGHSPALAGGTPGRDGP